MSYLIIFLFSFIGAIALLVLYLGIFYILEYIEGKFFSKGTSSYKIYLKSCFFYGECNLFDIETKHNVITSEWQSSDWKGFTDFFEVYFNALFVREADFWQSDLFTVKYAHKFIFVERERSLFYFPSHGGFVLESEHNTNDF